MEWFGARDVRLTASDVGAVLGHAKYYVQGRVKYYSTAEDVYLRKTFQGKPFKTNIACQHGHKYEPMAATAYEVVTGIKCWPEDIGLVTHRDYKHFGASPDRVAIENEILVEIKCPFRRKIEPGVIPEMYMDQIQFQMEVCDLDICHFVQFKPGNLAVRGILDITEVKRDPEWWKRHLPTLQAFWGRVQAYWASKPDHAMEKKDGEDDRAADSGFTMTCASEFVPDLYDISIQKHL